MCMCIFGVALVPVGILWGCVCVRGCAFAGRVCCQCCFSDHGFLFAWRLSWNYRLLLLVFRYGGSGVWFRRYEALMIFRF